MTVETSHCGIVVPWDGFTPSQFYRWWLPGVQAVGSGAPADLSGNSVVPVFGAGLSDANCWANAGYFSSVAGTNSGVVVPFGNCAWNMAAGESLLFSVKFRANDPTGAVTDGVMGTWSTAANGRGLRFVINASGNMVASVSDASRTATSAYPTSNVFASDAERVITVFVDGDTKMMYFWSNGTLISSTDVSTVTGNTTPVTGWAGGWAFGNDNNEAASVTYVTKCRDAHYLVFPSGQQPSDLTTVVNTLLSRPFYPLRDADLT